MRLGKRLSQKRKDLGMTQTELAEQMHVTRQTVSRWESGAVYPDVTKIAELASLLHVSCDYLLQDEMEQDAGEESVEMPAVSRLLQNTIGKRVKLGFYDDEEDIDLEDTECLVKGFEGNWMQVEVTNGKEAVQKLVAVSSILSVQLIDGE